MAKLNKRARANAELIPAEPLPLKDAVAALKKFKGPKFDQTVEICFTLGIDSTQADQLIRGAVALPHGVGKSKRVIAFCGSDDVAAAKEAGAVEAGADDLVKKVSDGWMDFDVAVASPDMMKIVSRLGRQLGPRGLMPTPKAGTVTTDIVKAVREYSAGKVEYRNDKGGNVQAAVGRMSFSDDHLHDNIDFFIQTILKAKPSSTKGTFVKKVTISGTMTPGVRIAV